MFDYFVVVARRKTIYEYHRVSFAYSTVENNTVIEMIALKSCLSFTDCQTCTSAQTSLTVSFLLSLRIIN